MFSFYSEGNDYPKYYSIIKVRLQVVLGQNINVCELIPKFNQIAVFSVT